MQLLVLCKNISLRSIIFELSSGIWSDWDFSFLNWEKKMYFGSGNGDLFWPQTAVIESPSSYAFCFLPNACILYIVCGFQVSPCLNLTFCVHKIK